MAKNKINKFKDIIGMNLFLNGGIEGGKDGNQGFPELVGKTVTFTSPVAATVAFVKSTNPNLSDQYTLLFADVKAQIEAGAAGVTAQMHDGRLVLVEVTPTSGVAIAGSSTGGHATLVGTVDLNTLTYGGGGTLDTLTAVFNIDGGGDLTVTFAAPGNRAAVISQINAVLLAAATASIDGNNHLVVSSATTGGTSTVRSKSGTGLTALGLTALQTVTGSATNQANTGLGYDALNPSVGHLYKPPGVVGSPSWTWAYSVNENMHVLFTWE